MSRIVNEQEYAVKRNEILDSARRFIYTKGFEQMSIQDILNDLGISKGAFYHYFGSKHALLEALTERTIDEGVALLLPIFEDPSLTAVEKIRHYFSSAAVWKTAQKDYLLGLMQVVYSDDNALFRQKMFSAAMNHLRTWLQPIIEQGIREGDLKPAYPALVSEIIFGLFQNLGDALAGKILPSRSQPLDSQDLVDTMAAFTDAMERILGAPCGSLKFMDDETIRQWALPIQYNSNGAQERNPTQ